MNIYKLWEDVDYQFINPINIEKFSILELLLHEPQSFGSAWKSFEVKWFNFTKGRKKLKEGDFSFLGSTPVLSEHALSNLKCELEKYGEFLPIYSQNKPIWFVLNVTNILPAFDKELSEFEYFRVSNRVKRINKYVFVKSIVAKNIIFRIPESPTNYFITEEFIGLVKNHNLKGFEFELVWSSDNTKKIGEIIRP